MPRCNACGQDLLSVMQCVLCGFRLKKFEGVATTPGGFPMCRAQAACKKRQAKSPQCPLIPDPEFARMVVVDSHVLERELIEKIKQLRDKFEP